MDFVLIEKYWFSSRLGKSTAKICPKFVCSFKMLSVVINNLIMSDKLITEDGRTPIYLDQVRVYKFRNGKEYS